MHYFKLHWSYLISFNLSKVGEIFWVKSERTISKFREKKQNFFVLLTYSIKRAREIRKFLVAVMQMYKKAWSCAKMFFCQSKPIVFLLFAVAIAKTRSCCHPEILLPWQGAKKIVFTACHSSKLKLAFTSPDVISTSHKNFLTSNWFHSSSVIQIPQKTSLSRRAS